MTVSFLILVSSTASLMKKSPLKMSEAVMEQAKSDRKSRVIV